MLDSQSVDSFEMSHFSSVDSAPVDEAKIDQIVTPNLNKISIIKKRSPQRHNVTQTPKSSTTKPMPVEIKSREASTSSVVTSDSLESLFGPSQKKKKLQNAEDSPSRFLALGAVQKDDCPVFPNQVRAGCGKYYNTVLKRFVKDSSAQTENQRSRVTKLTQTSEVAPDFKLLPKVAEAKSFLEKLGENGTLSKEEKSNLSSLLIDILPDLTLSSSENNLLNDNQLRFSQSAEWQNLQLEVSQNKISQNNFSRISDKTAKKLEKQKAEVAEIKNQLQSSIARLEESIKLAENETSFTKMDKDLLNSQKEKVDKASENISLIQGKLESVRINSKKQFEGIKREQLLIQRTTFPNISFLRGNVSSESFWNRCARAFDGEVLNYLEDWEKWSFNSANPLEHPLGPRMLEVLTAPNPKVRLNQKKYVSIFNTCSANIISSWFWPSLMSRTGLIKDLACMSCFARLFNGGCESSKLIENLDRMFKILNRDEDVTIGECRAGLMELLPNWLTETDLGIPDKVDQGPTTSVGIAKWCHDLNLPTEQQLANYNTQHDINHFGQLSAGGFSQLSPPPCHEVQDDEAQSEDFEDDSWFEEAAARYEENEKILFNEFLTKYGPTSNLPNLEECKKKKLIGTKKEVDKNIKTNKKKIC